MDVSRVAVLMALSFFLVHCASEKAPDNFVNYSSTCEAFADDKNYVVHWRSGETTVVQATDKQNFLRGFFEDHQEDILWAEHDYLVEVPTPATKDSLSVFSLPDPDWAPRRIQANEVWNQGVYGQDVLVAVIDTGVDIEHFQLAPSIFANPLEIENGEDTDGNGYIDDVHGFDFISNTGKIIDDKGHGTHVAGIISARHDMGYTQGIAPAAKILPLRTMNAKGQGSASDAAKSIEYAVDMGAKIINASWGGPNCSRTLYNALDRLKDKDVLFVTAAGNDALSLDHNHIFPAKFRFDHQLTVGASGTADFMNDFSNYSTTRVHLLAPGFFIWGTFPGNEEGPDSGTSMSTPLVSGAAALLKSAFPHRSMLEIRQAILAGTDKAPIIAGRQVDHLVSSQGRLNIWKSYQLLQNPQP